MIAPGIIRLLSCCLLVYLLTITPVCAAEPAIEDAFSPHAGATALILRSIYAAHHSIHVAAYSFTSKPIAWALLKAFRRGVDVRIVVDESQRYSRYGMAWFLIHQGVPVRLDDRYAIMHNKFMVIDQDTLELGSFNYTNPPKAATPRMCWCCAAPRKPWPITTGNGRGCGGSRGEA